MAIDFDNKIDAQLQNLVIDTPNVSKYIEHIYADYVELNALFLKEEVTIADISDKLQDVKDPIGEDSDLDADERILDEIASLVSERNDRIEERVSSIFNICKDRQKLYTVNEYPFDITGNQLKLKDNLSDKHKMYLLLLLCSNIKYFKNVTHQLTIDFELLSHYALVSYLPPRAMVKSFGKNSKYTGNAKEKIRILAVDMGIGVDDKSLDCVPPQNTQERGCDIVAWIPFCDNIPNKFIALSQCACGRDWETKQSETSLFANYFHFRKSPLHIMFVPMAISNTGDKFHQHDRVSADILLFDRKRIIEQFEECDFLSELKSSSMVEKSIKERIIV